MSKEKQIEEMANIIDMHTTFDTMWEECTESAEALYNAGYRKQSENVIELPCKVGDKVYVLSQKSIQEYTVHAIEFNENTTTIKCHSWLAERESLLHKHIAYFNKTDFDKIVFLTKEEAEAKIKGGTE